MGYARQIMEQYGMIKERFVDKGSRKTRFSVSCQHYSFAVEAFIGTCRSFGMDNYEFAIHETKTHEVMMHVRSMESEVGVLYLNDFNRKSITKLLHSNGLEFHTLTKCSPFVYLWKGHPLAKQDKITFEELADYPCLSFEQGDNSTFYLAEEILSTSDYQRTIKANDRATMLNLMIGLNGYTLCSGIICEELNGSDYIAVPFDADSDDAMEIGYITLKNVILSEMAEIYIEEIKNYLNI